MKLTNIMIILARSLYSFPFYVYSSTLFSKLVELSDRLLLFRLIHLQSDFQNIKKTCIAYTFSLQLVCFPNYVGQFNLTKLLMSQLHINPIHLFI